jgi:hypothetical protein
MTRATSLAWSALLTAGALSVAASGPAISQAEDPGLIDRDLQGQLDFRDVAFAECLGQSQCSVNGITVTAERRDLDGESWVSAQIYWDPVDGFGVMGGGQNDEIDFDERLLITFEGTKGATVNIERIWLSDIFIGEDERYANSDPAGPEDVEVAVIQSFFAGTMVNEALADGANVLPPDPFNEDVAARFLEAGDLLRRVVIQGETILVAVPSDNDGPATEFLSFPITAVDEEKLDLFEGIETVEIDLVDILAGFNDVPFNLAGTTNADFVQETLDDLAQLQEIRARAEENRLVSSVSNGELGVDMDASIDVDMLIFMAVLGGSNDYSVAGIVQP